MQSKKPFVAVYSYFSAAAVDDEVMSGSYFRLTIDWILAYLY